MPDQTPVPSRLGSVRLHRRQLLLGAAALAAGAALSPLTRTLSLRDAAADGVPNGALSLLSTYDDWRRSWDMIVPLTRGTVWPRLYLLYDRAGGYGSIQSVDQYGGARELRGYSDWRSTWSQIARSEFTGDPNQVGLVLYDRQAGYVSLQVVDPSGNLREVRTYPAYRRTWDRFVPLGSNQMLLYDRAAGYGTFFQIDPTGNVRELRSYNDWLDTWDTIVSGSFGFSNLDRHDLIFYDRDTGEAAMYAVDDFGGMRLVRTAADWRRTWDVVASGQMRFGSGFGADANLLLYDGSAGETVYMRVGPDGSLTVVHDDFYVSPGGWNLVAPVGSDLVLYYNRQMGRGSFYQTGVIVPPTPTPQPTPQTKPWPTPAPSPQTKPWPTEPPITPVEAKVRMVLAQGDRNKAWDTYTLKSPDPVEGGNGRSVITYVKNLTDQRVSLIHWDKNGVRKGPFFVKTGQSVADFNGMSVAGQWEAKITGSKSNAPARVTLEVGFR